MSDRHFCAQNLTHSELHNSRMSERMLYELHILFLSDLNWTTSREYFRFAKKPTEGTKKG